MRLGFGIGISYPSSIIVRGIVNPPEEDSTWLWNDNTAVLWEDGTGIVTENE